MNDSALKSFCYWIWFFSVAIVSINDLFTITLTTNPNIAGYGTILDKNGAMFTALALLGFLFFLYGSSSIKKTLLLYGSAYIATILSVPDAISQFNGLVYYVFVGDQDWPFGLAALSFLAANLFFYRRIIK